MSTATINTVEAIVVQPKSSSNGARLEKQSIPIMGIASVARARLKKPAQANGATDGIDVDSWCEAHDAFIKAAEQQMVFSLTGGATADLSAYDGEDLHEQFDMSEVELLAEVFADRFVKGLPPIPDPGPINLATSKP